MTWLDQTRLDMRFAIRAWKMAPGFAFTAMLTLALGIGANTAVFSVISGVLLRPLPFVSPDRLVQVTENQPRTVSTVATRGPVFARDLTDFRRGSRLVAAFVAYTASSRSLLGLGEPERLSVLETEPGLFALLGIVPMLGRTFSANDSPNVAVASAAFWRAHFGGDPAALGRVLSLGGEPYVLIGVMPDEFQFPYGGAGTDLWLPWKAFANLASSSNSRLDGVVARLKPGASLAAARQELNVMAAASGSGREAELRSLKDVVSGELRESLAILFGAVVMVLALACANVANLLLARTAAREREIAIRVALGAGRFRLIRQLLTESLMLAFAGTVGGLALGVLGTRALVRAAAHQLPRIQDVGLDWRVFLFLLAVCVITGVSFGLAPALAGALRGSSALKSRAAAASVRDGLMVFEVALSFVLLVAAALLLRTFLNLQHTDPGFRVENVLTVHVALPGAAESMQIEERITQIPGVRGAGLVSMLPLQSSGWGAGFRIPGRPDIFVTELRYVTPGYFRALGIPLRRGREFSKNDRAETARVILVNEALARQYFAGQDPVGLRIDRGLIVGVVGDVRPLKLSEPATPVIFYAMAQNFAQIRSNGSTLVVGGNVPVANLTAPVRAAFREVLPEQPLFRMQTMTNVLELSLSSQRLYAWLVGLFAIMGLLLAMAGLYGVTNYLTTLRTREFGIRMALGADSVNVIWLVMRRGISVVALGLAVGIGGSVMLTRVLESALYGIKATDPGTFAGVSVLLALVALCACWIPAGRAARVDPAVTLRAE